MKKVLAIASTGGHNVQLSLIIDSLSSKGFDVIKVRTKVTVDEKDDGYYLIDEISRSNLLYSPVVIMQIIKILVKTKVDVVLSTGALPGLAAIVCGRIFSKKTIWIDSIANSKKVSLSGRIAKYIAHHTFTQWPDLETKKIKYYGSVL
ncbi:hypothetical protein [Shewanella sp.]|uniref:hypothetical protein n=1 Tax=Shewanella sp. TaxID=50422 RepID=UPI004047DA87